MKRIARLTGFILVCLIFLIAGLITRPFTPRSKRIRMLTRWTRIWARAQLRMIGIRVVPDGLSPDHLSDHFLLVSNHQSYLDIIIIASFFPAVFVAKKEVSNWPLLGWMASLGAAVFIDRDDAHSGARGAFRTSSLLRDALNVQVFPESTTSDGTMERWISFGISGNC